MIHDIIKIRYVREGYLPNYPYHLISDEEMFRAFISTQYQAADDQTESNFITQSADSYFDAMYPMVMFSIGYDVNARDVYNTLRQSIAYHIYEYLTSGVSLPDWVYSYMLGAVIGPNHPLTDIHDLLVLIDADNLDDLFDATAAYRCYTVSKEWIRRLPNNSDVWELDNGLTLPKRPPTLFGEPHVIKSRRIHQLNVPN